MVVLFLTHKRTFVFPASAVTGVHMYNERDARNLGLNLRTDMRLQIMRIGKQDGSRHHQVELRKLIRACFSRL